MHIAIHISLLSILVLYVIEIYHNPLHHESTIVSADSTANLWFVRNWVNFQQANTTTGLAGVQCILETVRLLCPEHWRATATKTTARKLRIARSPFCWQAILRRSTPSLYMISIQSSESPMVPIPRTPDSDVSTRFY